MPEEIPVKAKQHYDEAVRILTEDMAQRRALRGTDIVVENLLEAIREHDQYFEAWRLLGEIYLGTEETLKGYLALQRAHRLQGDDTGVATLLGEAALILDRPHLSLRHLEQAHKAENVPLGARKLMALALAKAEKWEEALRAFGEALAGDPSDGDMRRECANLLGELGYPADAASVLADYLDPYRDFIDKQPVIIKTGWIKPTGAVLDRLLPGAAKRALEKERVPRPEDYRAWYAMGNLFLDGEEHEAAVVCFKRALRVHPDYYDALHNMGIALEGMGRMEDALQMYETAIEADPDSPEAYLSVAELLEDKSPDETDEIALNYLMYYRLDPEAEGFAEMETGLRERLEATPDIAQILLLAQVYLLREAVDKADQVLRLIAPAGTGEATFQWVKGRVFQEQGKADMAEKAYRAGLAIVEKEDFEPTMDEDNTEARIRFDLADLLSRNDRPAEAMKVLQEAEEILDADGLGLLAELLAKAEPEKAEETLKRALNMDPEHPDALLGLADRMIDTGRIEEGIVLLERALKVDPEDTGIADRLRELYPKIDAPELSPP